MSTPARRALVATLGQVPAALSALTAAWWWSDLPSRLPTHWTALDSPDDFDSRTATVTVVLIITAVGGVLVIGACAWCGRSPSIAQGVAALGGFVGGLTAGTWLSIAASTLLAPTPEQADITWWLVLALAGGAWALIALPLGDRTRVGVPCGLEQGGDVPFFRLAPGERVSWSRVIGPTWLTWVVAGLFVVEAGIALAAPAAAPGAVIALVLTVLCARLEITVDHRGLRLVAGLVRLPIKRIAVDEVVRADVEQIAPGEWGGWGYRILPGRSALVLRSGPALVVTTAGDRRFAATIDDPAVPAGLLNALASARRPG